MSIERQYDRPFPSLDKKAKTVDIILITLAAITLIVTLYDLI